MVEMAMPGAMNRISELEALPYVQECSIHGSSVHVLLDHQENAADLEAYTAVKANVITPSLEDVFITLAKKHR